jgi:hypothetical protein
MARAKIVETTATETPKDRAQAPIEETHDPFEFFKDETQECLIALRRLEPVMEKGQHVAGHLPSLTLSPDEARNLAGTLMSRPGCGGGLYHVQFQRRKPSGGYEFGASFRLRISGPSRALELFEAYKPAAAIEPQPNAVPLPLQTMLPMQTPPMQWPAYPPQYPPPQYQQQQNAPQNPDLPGLLRYLGEFVQKQNAPSMDMVQMIQALQRTVQGEDELTKFARFAQMLRKIQPEAGSEPATPKMDWSAVLLAAKEVLKPSPSAAPVVPVGPPGWNWDGRVWVRAAAAPRRMADVPAPPGWEWDGNAWREKARYRNESESEVKGEGESESEDEGEGEGESEDEGGDEVYSADELTEFLAAQMQKMPKAEVEKLKSTVKSFAAMLE